jgi:hypothetical protein
MKAGKILQHALAIGVGPSQISPQKLTEVT